MRGEDRRTDKETVTTSKTTKDGETQKPNGKKPKRQLQTKLAIQQYKIDQKILANEKKIKDSKCLGTESNNINNTRPFKIMKENSTKKLAQGQISNQRLKKQNSFRVKYGERT